MGDAELGLREALALVNAASASGEDGRPGTTVGLACSFTPHHLEILLKAHLLRRRPDRPVDVVVGLYGDLAGTLDEVAAAGCDAAAVVLEWPDLDPRLGMRESAAAPVADDADVVATAQARLARLAPRVTALAERCPVALVTPTLALPPAYATGSSRQGGLEAALRAQVAAFAAAVGAAPGVRLVDPLPFGDPGAGRDLRQEIRSGFPLTVPRASALARALAAVLVPDPPKKGLITDLDDTLWRGLVGEVGPDAVRWGLDDGAHVHALYQQLLASLSARGVLLGIASKNDLPVVEAALARPDLLLDPERVFPIVVSWGPKSAAVTSILEAWNIGAGDVVFVDDNLLELAEVEATHPGITTKRFTPEDPDAVAVLLTELQGAFWREGTTAEDELRVASLKAATEVAAARAGATDEAGFLADLQATITIGAEGWRLPRALELVNKTNQFNLNGRRLDEVAWEALGQRKGGVTWTLGYGDRFGPLGVVGVVAGVVEEGCLTIDCWVLSCRAFSRGIEHHVLTQLLARDDVEEVVFDFEPTERNAVLARFLSSVGLGGDPARLDRGALEHSGLGTIHAVVVES